MDKRTQFILNNSLYEIKRLSDIDLTTVPPWQIKQDIELIDKRLQRVWETIEEEMNALHHAKVMLEELEEKREIACMTDAQKELLKVKELLDSFPPREYEKQECVIDICPTCEDEHGWFE